MPFGPGPGSLSLEDGPAPPPGPSASQHHDGTRDAAALEESPAAVASLAEDAAGSQPPWAPAAAAGPALRGHSVVELSFTSSVRFLQPGLLLQASARRGVQAASLAATPLAATFSGHTFSPDLGTASIQRM